MRGQWVGQFSSGQPGDIILNVDALPTCYRAVAYLRPYATTTPRSLVRFRTEDMTLPVRMRVTEFFPLHPETGLLSKWQDIKDKYPSDVQMSQWIDVVCEMDGDVLKLRWSTDIGLIGQCELPRSKAGTASELQSADMSWPDFKTHIDSLRGRKYLFRGQSAPWRLRTTFHRHGRADMEGYLSEDVLQLHKHLTSRTRHVFDLENETQLAAFLGLVQHHGYPTPLLDWTASPYVAAFFAYRGVERNPLNAANKRVRIFKFNQDLWMGIQRLPRYAPLLLPVLNISLVDVLAIENERMIPQQAVSMQSNVDDVEAYIKKLEERSGQTVLEAIDLPVADRERVMEELRYMGITAASMFPGLDGVCEELRELNFPR